MNLSVESVVLIISAFVWAFLIFVIKQVFNIVFRGFTPFLSSRPWVIEKIIDTIVSLPVVEQHKKRKSADTKLKIYAIGSGRSGLLHFLGKEIKNTQRVGIEYEILAFITSKIQAFLRHSEIKVLYSELWKARVNEADILYLHLEDLISMRDMDKKFKFECRQGTIIISNGFVIPNYKPKKIIEIPNKKARFSIFSSESKLLSSRTRKARKENKVYFYEI